MIFTIFLLNFFCWTFVNCNLLATSDLESFVELQKQDLAYKISYLELQDDKLCSTGTDKEYPKKCFDEGYKKEIHCYDREKRPCYSALIHDKTFSYDMISSIMLKLESHMFIRQIVIEFDKSFKYSDYEIISSEVDKLIMPRPWWRITVEPYKWQVPMQSKIVLERVHHRFEHRLRFISSVQYPDSTTCSKSLMLLGHDTFFHPGASTVLRWHFVNHIEYPFAVQQIYSSSSNNVNDNTAFMTGSDCPKTVNKFECAFIPMTNCTIPTSLTSCKEKNCVRNIKETRLFYTNASTSGERILLNTEIYKKAYRNRGKYNNLRQQNLLSNIKPYKVPYVAPYDPNVTYDSSFGVASNKIIYDSLFILRRNAFYRSKIAEVITNFRKLNSFPVTERCVAAQVMRFLYIYRDKYDYRCLYCMNV
jgi:hypothetical protein